MVVVAVEVSQDLPTVLADVVLACHVSALHVFVDVGAPVAPVVALRTGPVASSEMAHFPPRLVLRVDKVFGFSVWIMNRPHVFVQSTPRRDVLPTLESPISLYFLVLPQLLHRVEYFPAELAGEGRVEMSAVHVVSETPPVAGLVAAQLAGQIFVRPLPLLTKPPVASSQVRDIKALLSLVQLLPYWALIGRELHSDEIFSK